MKALGRNQLIAVAAYGSTFVFSVVMVLIDKVTGPEWLSFAQVFMPIAIGTIIGPSAVLKTAGVIKNGKKPVG